MNRGRSRAWLFPVLALLTIALLLLHESGVIQPLEDALQVVLAPVQRALSGLFDGVVETVGAFRDLRELRDENARLRELNDALVAENVRLKQIEAENVTLRNLLSFTQEHPLYLTQVAAVIGRDPSPYRQFITINAGRREGLEPGMPVVTAGSALVGRVEAVGLNTSKVQLIIDSTSAVNARVQSSRVTGLVEGQPDGELILTQIPLDATVNVGDLVLTSGLGGNLPRNLVVGQVSEVIKRDIDLFQSARVRPALEFSQLELVLVITNFESLPTEPEIEPGPTPTP
jgi:rod shape-determining protein MreC